MNKKLFTLAAALMMGSAFTVNAQTNQVAGGTKVTDLTSWYYIGTDDATPATRYYLSAKKVALDNMTVVETTATQDAANVTNVDKFLWKVSVITKNGVIDGYQLTNKATGGKMTFKSG